MHVITVRPNFARRTFHHEKTTHVARNAILWGRQDDWVLIRVSNSTNKTSYEEMGKESSSSTTCSEDKNCGCCQKGHIVGLVKLGSTAKVWRLGNSWNPSSIVGSSVYIWRLQRRARDNGLEIQPSSETSPQNAELV
jgi:hypothetical protein